MPQDDDDDLVKVAKATCKRLSEELQAQDQQYEDALHDLHAQKKEALCREATVCQQEIEQRRLQQTASDLDEECAALQEHVDELEKQLADLRKTLAAKKIAAANRKDAPTTDRTDADKVKQAQEAVRRSASKVDQLGMAKSRLERGLKMRVDILDIAHVVQRLGATGPHHFFFIRRLQIVQLHKECNGDNYRCNKAYTSKEETPGSDRVEAVGTVDTRRRILVDDGMESAEGLVALAALALH